MLNSSSFRDFSHENLKNFAQNPIIFPCKFHLPSRFFVVFPPKESRVLLGFNLHLQTRTISAYKTLHNNKNRRYSGSLPSILHALETENDVDLALKSWIGKLNPKEQTVILKEQRDWSKVLSVFRWIKSQKNHLPNVIHYNVVLRSLGKFQQWDQLRLCWIEMAKNGVFPTNNTYGTLIDVYGKAGLAREALEWLKHMKIRGIFPDEVTMNTVVHILKESGKFDQAELFFKNWCVGRIELGDLDLSSIDSSPTQMSPKYFLSTELFKSGKTPPLKDSNYRDLRGFQSSLDSSADGEVSVRKPRIAATYNTLIDLYAKAGRLKDASNAFVEMLRSEIVPDTVTFNTMIYTCGSHGLLSEAESLLNKMEERGIPPDTRTFNTFIALYADSGDIDAVLRCYRKIGEVGLYPNTVTYRTILHRLCKKKMIVEVEAILEEMDKSGVHVDEQSLPVIVKMYIDEGKANRGMTFLQKILLTGKISSKTYAAVIDVYAKKGFWNEAEAVFFGRPDLGNRRDTVEYNVMIKAYGRSKLYDKALSLFQSMKNRGVWPDECTYNSLIQMLSGGELPESARELLNKMQESGFRPRCATFSAIIASYVRLGQLSEAIDVYEEMLRAGVEPNEIVYGSLINGCAEAGKVEEALSYFCKLEESGFSANQVVFTSLIKAYRKVGCWKEAQDIYAKMQHLENGPDIIASNSMIDLYTELGMVKEAKLIFDSLRENGRANGVSFAIMMYLYKSMGMLDEAIEITHEMHQSGLLIDCVSYNNVLASYAGNGQIRECAEILHQMLTEQISPNNFTFKVIFTALKKGGFPLDAVSQLEASYKDAKPYSTQAIITSLFSVVGMHNFSIETCEDFIKDVKDLDSTAYNVAIYAYGASGEANKALNLFMKMLDKGLEADIVTYINLAYCYGKAGLVEGVKRIYSKLKYREIEPNESLFRAVIDAYNNAGRHDLADLVSQEMRFSFHRREQSVHCRPVKPFG